MIDWEEILETQDMDELKKAKLWLFQENMRLEKENAFFDKKMEILMAGFRQLEDDRKAFEMEKKRFLARCAYEEEEAADSSDTHNVAEVLFRNTDNPLALKKRYRDLVKIFHPDNLFGDEELAQQINREFMKRREECL